MKAKASYRPRPLISLCMIVRNEESVIARCLNSVRGIADEIIIVDTGSADRTVEIARSYGAQVIDFPWTGDFSEARNRGIAKARGEWILVLDADEWLVVPNARDLRQTMSTLKADALFLRIHNLTSETENKYVTANVIRMFRNRPEYRFEGSIHEQVLYAIQRHNPSANFHMFADVHVNHTGYLGNVYESKDKHRRNLTLLLQEMERNPESLHIRFHLGRQYLVTQEYEKAIEHFEKCIAQNGVAPEASAYRDLMRCYRMLNRSSDVKRVYELARKYHPKYTDLVFEWGLNELREKHFEGAVEAFNQCLELGDSPMEYTSDIGVGTHRSWHHLSIGLQQLGRFEEAVDAVEQALQHEPTLTDSLKQWAAICCQGGVPWEDRLAKIEEAGVLNWRILSHTLAHWVPSEAQVNRLNPLRAENQLSLLLYGFSALAARRFKDAADAFSEAYERYNNRQAGYFNWLALLLGSQPETALDVLRAMRATPASPADLAYLYVTFGWLSGYQSMELEAGTQAAMMEWLYQLASELLQLGFYQEVLRLGGGLLALREPQAYLRLGQLFAEFGYENEARALLTQSVQNGLWNRKVVEWFLQNDGGVPLEVDDLDAVSA